MSREIGLGNAKQFMWLIAGVAVALFLLSQFAMTRSLTGLGTGSLPAIGTT